MSILERYATRQVPAPRAVVFISRKFGSGREQRRGFDRIVDLERKFDKAIIVAACDEMGVIPAHRHRMGEPLLRVPAYFFGIRRWLRRRLCEEYGCVEVVRRNGPPIHSDPIEHVRVAEQDLDTAAAVLHALREALLGLPDSEARLRPALERLDVARKAYGRALHYWLETSVTDSIRDHLVSTRTDGEQ